LGRPVLRLWWGLPRSHAELDCARAAVEKSGPSFTLLDDKVETMEGDVSICPMHLAKGLEFRAGVVMALRRRNHSPSATDRNRRR
jgi:hypothetical protein